MRHDIWHTNLKIEQWMCSSVTDTNKCCTDYSEFENLTMHVFLGDSHP